jgi:hypothetical protein
MSLTATPLNPGPESAVEANSGAARHWRALEGLYASAPINRLFDSRLTVLGEGAARIAFTVDSKVHHAAGAAHGTIYFKMLFTKKKLNQTYRLRACRVDTYL